MFIEQIPFLVTTLVHNPLSEYQTLANTGLASLGSMTSIRHYSDKLRCNMLPYVLFVKLSICRADLVQVSDILYEFSFLKNRSQIADHRTINIPSGRPTTKVCKNCIWQSRIWLTNTHVRLVHSTFEKPVLWQTRYSDVHFKR